jgi:AraC-like DNA-binding protein
MPSTHLYSFSINGIPSARLRDENSSAVVEVRISTRQSARGIRLGKEATTCAESILLLETSDTLDKIAARIGFADASNFSRTFKGIDGIAPGEFRRHKQSY